MRVVLVPVWGAGWLMQQQRWGCRPWACAQGSYSVDARLCIWPSSQRKEQGTAIPAGEQQLLGLGFLEEPWLCIGWVLQPHCSLEA